jgi:putative two-component system response regulator
VTFGANILGGSHIPLLQMATDIALYHHEKWNGSGYLQGLQGEDIPEAARIVAIADVYDALSNDRVYRQALPEKEVLAIMREGCGVHFDPRIFDCFMDLLPVFQSICRKHADPGQDFSPDAAAPAG